MEKIFKRLPSITMDKILKLIGRNKLLFIDDILKFSKDLEEIVSRKSLLVNLNF